MQQNKLGWWGKLTKFVEGCINDPMTNIMISMFGIEYSLPKVLPGIFSGTNSL
jgi:hypothetical protein